MEYQNPVAVLDEEGRAVKDPTMLGLRLWIDATIIPLRIFKDMAVAGLESVRNGMISEVLLYGRR